NEINIYITDKGTIEDSLLSKFVPGFFFYLFFYNSLTSATYLCHHHHPIRSQLASLSRMRTRVEPQYK
ncbi:hypothetical protein HPB47_026421, partial [Ixodes persulcatus]